MAKRKTDLEYRQLSIFDLDEISIEAAHEKWPEGSIVKNICNNKEYTLKKDSGDIVEVFDKEKGYLIMAKADIKLKREPKSDGIYSGCINYNWDF